MGRIACLRRRLKPQSSGLAGKQVCMRYCRHLDRVFSLALTQCAFQNALPIWPHCRTFHAGPHAPGLRLLHCVGQRVHHAGGDDGGEQPHTPTGGRVHKGKWWSGAQSSCAASIQRVCCPEQACLLPCAGVLVALSMRTCLLAGLKSGAVQFVALSNRANSGDGTRRLPSDPHHRCSTSAIPWQQLPCPQVHLPLCARTPCPTASAGQRRQLQPDAQ